MNKFLNDDFFSPIRQVTSESDCSDDSENLSNIPSSNMTVASTKSVKNKHISECKEIICTRETNKSESCSSEFNFASRNPEVSNDCTPVAKRDSSNPKRDSKALVSDFKLKFGKGKDLKDNVLKGEHSSKRFVNKIKTEKEKALKGEGSSKSLEGHLQNQEYQQRKSAPDHDAANSNSKQIHAKKRPTSLALSKREDSKSTTKNIKKEKNISQPSKNIYNQDMMKSNAKHAEKQLIDNSLEASVKAFEGKSTDSNSCISLTSGSSNKKSDTRDLFLENSSSSNPSGHSPFEVSVEKIVHDLISSECDKIRQNMYAHQMSFYRELNQVKDEMKTQHVANTERMFKIVEELMRMNFSLKSMPLRKT